MTKLAIVQHAAGMPTIDGAPRDGSTIYSFDGVWWRDRTCWQLPLGASLIVEEFRPEKRWIAFGFLPVKPTHWCRPEDATPEIEAMVTAGYARK